MFHVVSFTLTGTQGPVFGVLLLSQVSYKKSHNVSRTDLDYSHAVLSQKIRAKWPHKMTS